jgi:hypothetical protein
MLAVFLLLQILGWWLLPTLLLHGDPYCTKDIYIDFPMHFLVTATAIILYIHGTNTCMAKLNSFWILMLCYFVWICICLLHQIDISQWTVPFTPIICWGFLLQLPCRKNSTLLEISSKVPLLHDIPAIIYVYH